MRSIIAILLCIGASGVALGETKLVKIFVGLCDNKTQGIAPVPEKIGDGDLPMENLYWGCAEGVRTWFQRSPNWTISAPVNAPSEPVLDRFEARHKSRDIHLTAEAYRGSALRQCAEAFEAAVYSGDFDLVAFVGHNALMDFDLPPLSHNEPNGTDVAVLCCKSAAFFQDRIVILGGKPVLLTEQFMYPGAFLIHDAIESWSAGGSLAEIRNAAGKAYAANQKISVKAATGVFTDLTVNEE
jgi:hypothetical protein